MPLLWDDPFIISGIPQGVTIQSATFDLNNHTVEGGPFTLLGSLGVYHVQYGEPALTVSYVP